MKKDIFVILVITLLIVIVTIAFQNFNNDKSDVKVINPPVILSSSLEGTLSKEFNINAYIESEEMVTVLPRVMGMLDETLVEVGDHVIKDQQIARIDSELLQLNLRQADSAYQYARQNLERTKALFDQNITSQQNFDLAKSQYESSSSIYEMAKLQFEYAEITSPISGSVLKKHTSEGSLASQETPIMTIGTIDELKLTARIPERYFDIFNNKLESIKVTLTRSGNINAVHNAQIKAVAPVISPESKNFEVICHIDNSNNQLRPGMFVKVRFLLNEKNNIYYLPFSILAQENTAWFYDEVKQTANKIKITPDFFNDLYFQIPEEIKDLLYIVEGHSFLRDGQSVAVINKEIFN